MKTSNASVSIGFAAQSVAAAFWLGVLAGAVGACSTLAVAEAYSLVHLYVPRWDMGPRQLNKRETDQQVHSNLDWLALSRSTKERKALRLA